jgi:hypothetical protein
MASAELSADAGQVKDLLLRSEDEANGMLEPQMTTPSQETV